MNFQAYTLSKHPEWACIQIKAPETQNRTPIHLCCIIDTSGSMEDSYKLENVKRSLQFLLDFLGPNDKLSLITFSENAKTIINQVAITDAEKHNIRARIELIDSESNTNLSAGLIVARDSLLQDTSTIKQGILLLTDGHANLGLCRSVDILELIRNTVCGFSGTSISCIGYGTDHNAELLQSIGSEGGGSYYVVNNLENVAAVFGDVLGALITCSYQQVRVLLPISTEIKSRYATNVNGENLEVIIGDLPSGMEGAFLAKMPTGTSLTLRAYDLTTHSPVNMSQVIIQTSDNILQVNGMAHYLRFEVLGLIEKSRILLERISMSDDIAAHLQKINDCIQQIEQHKAENEHSLWQILLDELTNCKQSLENRNFGNSMENTQLLTQHGAYLGMMRGIPAQMATPGPTPIGRTFSNYAQQNISSQLQASVTPIAMNRRQRNTPGDPVDISTLSSISGHTTPTELSPSLVPATAPTLTPLPRINRQSGQRRVAPVRNTNP